MVRVIGSLALVVVVVVVAAFLARGDVGAPAAPSAAATPRVDSAAALPAERTPAAPGGEVREAAALATPPAAAAADLLVQLHGAPAAQLYGVATVRRRDGAVESVRFDGGAFVVAARDTIDAVNVHVPGFAVVWPAVRRDANVLTVTMQRAGSIRVELRDTNGQPLADRFVWGQCQGTHAPAGGATYSGTARAVTDARGCAVLADLVPGTWNIGSYRVAEWDAAVAEGLAVTEGVVTERGLVAAVCPPERCGGFWFARAAAPGMTVDDTLVTDRVFVAGARRYELNLVGAQVRCIVRGTPGEVLVGHLGAVSRVDPTAEPVPLSPAITVTIGAIVPWTPVWLR